MRMHRLLSAVFVGLLACESESVTDGRLDASYGHTHDDAQSDALDDLDDASDASSTKSTFPYDAATYDASWYDGDLAEPCPILDTPCAQPAYIVYGCACFNAHCSDGSWAVIDGGGPCH
jgi:hypothetical protein